MVRTRADPLSLAPAVQNELRVATGGLKVAQTRTMEEIVSLSSASRNLDNLLLTVFECSALLLAVIGIYGLLAYSAALRTGEIGIRLALGAESSGIRSMVVAEGMRLVLAGIAAGSLRLFMTSHVDMANCR